MKQSESVLLVGFLRVESTETKFLKFRPSGLRTQKRQKRGSVCVSQVLVTLQRSVWFGSSQLHPARKSGKVYEFLLTLALLGVQAVVSSQREQA